MQTIRAMEKRRASIQLALNDLRAGKKVGHLSPAEVADLIARCEQRLAVLNVMIADSQN